MDKKTSCELPENRTPVCSRIKGGYWLYGRESQEKVTPGFSGIFLSTARATSSLAA